SLASYGITVKLLQDVLPFDEPLEAVTIRNHLCTLAERLEEELGEEQGAFIEDQRGHLNRKVRFRSGRALLPLHQPIF
ncbi:MAG TPA: hypothetical protein VI542_19030, partial [Candidatus Tectomicrobia bacterium]